MSVKNLHDKAMALTDEARLHAKDQPAVARDYYRQAYQYEKQALLLLSELDSAAPSQRTKSVLTRSAASMAMLAGLHKEAGALVHSALVDKDTDPAISPELEELLGPIYKALFTDIQKTQGIALSSIIKRLENHSEHLVTKQNHLSFITALNKLSRRKLKGINIAFSTSSSDVFHIGYFIEGRYTTTVISTWGHPMANALGHRNIPRREVNLIILENNYVPLNWMILMMNEYFGVSIGQQPDIKRLASKSHFNSTASRFMKKDSRHSQKRASRSHRIHR